MNWSSLPPLSALRAFAAYAQTGSVAQAGAALNVTHAAVSQQMRALETHLGLSLLDRSARSLSLTPEGEILARALLDGFGQLIQTVEALTGADAGRPLHVACTPSFAANWLMPRLAGFRALCPDVELMINPDPRLTDPAPGGVDVALRYGTGPWKGLDSRLLMRAPLVVVGAPSLFQSGLPQTPRDLVTVPWLQELGQNETSRWLETRGIVGQRLASVTHVPGNLMIDGVRSGQGIAIATRIAVAEDLRAGRLLALFEDAGDAGYHIVTAPGVTRPALRDFIRWLRREAAENQGDDT
ncbi:LysR family transcriptional regulator [Tropicibacter oceani]|uniref:LysR family transcriptional regulator n=1 Tax=Tropicibacter oceani TaxID=3058420 RepID=A0ABY8QGU9_9RHOB|nr:LysR family transcriptional regulator [Tropicibacter oceani]WGW03866.1 LysR family transcriptional regulator [Tropicibacter oceani]